MKFDSVHTFNIAVNDALRYYKEKIVDKKGEIGDGSEYTAIAELPKRYGEKE